MRVPSFSNTKARANKSPFFSVVLLGVPIPPETGSSGSGVMSEPVFREFYTERDVVMVAVADEASGVKIRAFLAMENGSRPSVIALKQFCAQRLPRYMAPDLFSVVEALPRTSTDKIDYQALLASA